MVETKIVEFRVLRNALINGLIHLSNVSDKAVVAAITHPEEGILGFSLNNVLTNDENPEYQSSASYALVIGEEISAFPERIDPKDWPVFYICCTEQFIKSVSTLPPRNEKFLDVKLYQTKDTTIPNTVKSETVISGEHNSHTASIIRHSSSLNDKSELKVDDAQLALYR